MGAEAVATPGRRGVLGRLVEFLRDAYAELRKVTWPARDEIRKSTIAIMIFVGLLGIVIGLMDILFKLVFVDAVARWL